jgi:hypothetical protein
MSPNRFRQDIPVMSSARRATPLSSGVFAMPQQSVDRCSKSSVMHGILVVRRGGSAAARRSGP